MPRFSLVAHGLAGLGVISMALASPLTPRACDCWQTKDSALTFTNHKVLDFRSLSQYVSSVPATITTTDENTNAAVTSDYFNTAEWTDMFGIQSWTTRDTTVQMANSPNNVYVQQDSDSSTYLTLRTHRNSGFQSAAEIESVIDDYTAMSVRVVARTHGDGGACTGIFTYKADAAGAQHESDMEILTDKRDATIWYTTHPESENSGHTTGYVSPSLPGGGVWTDFHEYRLDWTQPTSTFYVNGTQNGQLAHSYAQIPSYLILNAWSQGNSEWEGTMDVGGAAYLDVKYIELAYNRSSTSSATCSSICSL
jgi:hypothetical protein